MKGEKYDKEFYLNETIKTAKDLLGSKLCTNINKKFVSGIIVEVEAYLGKTDKGSHAYGGKRTKRTEVMYQPGGISYIYLIYGLYSLFNIVTRKHGIPHAILIRALEPEKGIEIMKERRKTGAILNLTSGPGKLCLALGMTRDQNGLDLTGDSVWIEKPEIIISENKIVSAKRIGIDYAGEDKDKLWRFYIKDNPHVSKRLPANSILDNKEIS